MSQINKKAFSLAKKNLIEKFKNWQGMVWTVGFPIMMLLVYKLVFTGDSGVNAVLDAYDICFPGIVVFSTGMTTVSSAVMFAGGKKDGTLERLDSMPVGRANIFIGAILSELVFMNFQIILTYSFGYGILGANFESWISLLFGYAVALIYGIGALGLGVIISSFSNSPESANGFGLMTHIPLMMASGAFFPFESKVVFFTPQYWAKQIFLQFTVLGDSLSDNLYSSSLFGISAEETSITILGGFGILIGFTVLFLFLGIRIFQKKTNL